MTPGDLLAVLLHDRCMTQSELARTIGRPAQMVSEVVTDKKRVTATTAVQLQRVFGLPASIWLALQAHTDLVSVCTAGMPDNTRVSVQDKLASEGANRSGHIEAYARSDADALDPAAHTGGPCMCGRSKADSIHSAPQPEGHAYLDASDHPAAHAGGQP